MANAMRAIYFVIVSKCIAIYHALEGGDNQKKLVYFLGAVNYRGRRKPGVRRVHLSHRKFPVVAHESDEAS